MNAKARLRQHTHLTSPSAVVHAAPQREDDDGALILRVAARDRQAFETLYHRYAPRLARYLAKLLRQRDLVEEVCNDAMLVVGQGASRFNHTCRLSTWIFSIAHHKALKALARAAPRCPDVPVVLPDAGIDRHDPEAALAHQERQRTLASALETLPPDQRAVVELTLYHDFSYQEIAEVTGCPVNTVKTRMFHARRRLAQLVAVQGPGGPLGRQEGPE